MRVLLVSTYELGHQPLHVASPAAALRTRGHDVRVADLSVEPLDPGDVEWAGAVAFSVPMHTAMRLALRAVEHVREMRPDLPVCLYGLYATVGEGSADADRLIAGEYEPALVAWVEEPPSRVTTPVAVTDLHRTSFSVPERSGLPPLDRYAHLDTGFDRRVVGYVESSHGCRYRCRHCPIPAVYDGRFRVVPDSVVVDDIARLVESGAEHITFGDPDFLNGPKHSLRVIRTMHERHPDLTFDITTKVELILRHRDVWGELADAGLQFVVSAFETTNDTILSLLDKGHTVADEAEAVHLVRSHGVEIRPSWLPFTPWTRLQDLVDIVEFLDAHTLDVDPVQLTIRLLIPNGSLLLDAPELAPYLDGYSPAHLGWHWHAADPAVDELAARLARIVGDGADRPAGDLLAEIRNEIFAAAGRQPHGRRVLAATGPRLTEPWFC